MRGRKPKPTATKILEGNPGKRALPKNEPKPEVAAPDAPDFLTPGALEEWNRLAPELEGNGILTRVDRAALAAYCQLYDRWAMAERKVSESGPVVKTKQGNVIQSPYLGVANTALKLLHKFASEFGLTPSSRSRVTVAGKDGASEINDFLNGGGMQIAG